MSAHVGASRRAPTLIRWGDPAAAARAAAALRMGLVVAIPTDTVYGLAAAIEQPRAIDRLFVLKHRTADKAIPVLLDDPRALKDVALPVTRLAEWLAERFWPGALTLVVAALPNLPAGVTSIAEDGMRTVAVRVPDHDLARRIICMAGGALAVTSANRSGEYPALDAKEVIDLGDAAPDMIVDGRRTRQSAPSTVVRALSSEIAILREGAIPASEIAAAVSEIRECFLISRPIPPHTV